MDETQPPEPDQVAGEDNTSTLRIEIAARTIWQVIGALLVTIAAINMASRASSLLIMLALSFFFSLALDPAVRHLHARYGWRRGACVGVVYAAGIAFLLFMVLILIPSIGELAARVSENADDWLAELNAWTTDTLGVPIPIDTTPDQAQAVGSTIQDFADGSLGPVLNVASAGIGLVFSLATIAMFTFYLTADAKKVRQAVLRLFSPKAQARIGWVWDQAIVQTGGYFYSRLLLMVINGIGFFVTLVLVGMPIGLSLAIGLVAAFVSVFIPAVGTYIGGALPTVLALALVGLVPALIVLGYILVYQQIENYWLAPKISANTMSLNGGVAFGAALAGGAVAGPLGAFVALPVAALISAMISNFARSYDVVYVSSLEDDDSAPDAD